MLERERRSQKRSPPHWRGPECFYWGGGVFVRVAVLRQAQARRRTTSVPPPVSRSPRTRPRLSPRSRPNRRRNCSTAVAIRSRTCIRLIISAPRAKRRSVPAFCGKRPSSSSRAAHRRRSSPHRYRISTSRPLGRRTSPTIFPSSASASHFASTLNLDRWHMSTLDLDVSTASLRAPCDIGSRRLDCYLRAPLFLCSQTSDHLQLLTPAFLCPSSAQVRGRGASRAFPNAITTTSLFFAAFLRGADRRVARAGARECARGCIGGGYRRC